MHEMGLVVAVIVLTLLVMGGLVMIFRKWLATREDLMKRTWAAEEGVGGSDEGTGLGRSSRKRDTAVA